MYLIVADKTVSADTTWHAHPNDLEWYTYSGCSSELPAQFVSFWLQTVPQLTRCLKESLLLTDKFETSCVIEISADRKEWS